MEISLLTLTDFWGGGEHSGLTAARGEAILRRWVEGYGYSKSSLLKLTATLTARYSP